MSFLRFKDNFHQIPKNSPDENSTEPNWINNFLPRLDGSLIYTDKFLSYNGLISYGFRHMRIDHGKRFVNGKVCINGIEGFWSFAKERLMKYHGVNPVKFPLYLKELEFRYNNRHQDLLML